MTYKEFISKFNNKVFSIGYNTQLILAIEVCKKLYFDYVAFLEKYQWGNQDILINAIKILEQSKTQEIERYLIEQTLKKMDIITPDLDDFGSDELGSYALNACAAVYSSLQFLLDKLPKHIYDVGICLTDTIDFKIQEHHSLTQKEIDNHPLMIETRNYLVREAG